MKVATLEKFHLGGGGQDPGDPGVGKVGRGGGGFFFPLQAGDGKHVTNIMTWQLVTLGK